MRGTGVRGGAVYVDGFCVGYFGLFNAVEFCKAELGQWTSVFMKEATGEMYTLSLRDAVPVFAGGGNGTSCCCFCDDCRGACGVRGMCRRGVGMHATQEWGVMSAL